MMAEINNELKDHINKNMKTGTQPDGQKMKPLSKAWIARKGHKIPYLWKGLFYKSIRDKKTKDGYEISIANIGNPSRAGLAPTLNKTRPFFGFTKNTGDKIFQSAVNKRFKF